METSKMDNCFKFFGPILNGIAFEFSKCYMQCSKEFEKDEHLQKNIQISYTGNDGDKKDIKGLDYEVEKCRNASKRGYVENNYLTFLELQDCIVSTSDMIEPSETITKRNSSKSELARLVGVNQETTNVIHSDYQGRKICDID